MYSLQFEWTKVPFKNAKNGPFWRIFEQPKAYCQVVLPDRSIRQTLKIGQKLKVGQKLDKN